MTLLLACNGPAGDPPGANGTSRSEKRSVVSESPVDDAEESIRIVFLGDSLSAGMGVNENEAFPAVVEGHLRDRGWDVQVFNAGISGDTTAGGVSRLDWILSQNPQIVVVELGANDGLRGMSVQMTEANLRAMISKTQQAGIRVLLAGMMVPPNYGADYSERFNDVFPGLAEELEVPLVPFLLEGVAAEPDLNLIDGIHPNPEGHQRVAETVLPYLETILKDLKASDSSPDA